MLATVAAQSALGAAREPPGTFSATVAPGKAHEECVRVDKGKRMHYKWRSTVPVDFNIHYHDGAEVFYPVKREGKLSARGILRAKKTEEFCWMWSANASAKIEGRIW